LPQGIEQTVAEVEAFLEKNPRNGRGWELLAPVYIRLGRFEDAVKARRNALEILGPDAARLGDLGEAVFMAAGGVVTPEARDLFVRAEAADDRDVMAQYYRGLGAKQEGILRRHLILPNGRVRDSVFFSIIDSEWPNVKERLQNRLRQT